MEVNTFEHRLPLGYRNILKTHVLSQPPPPNKKYKAYMCPFITKEVKREGNM